ncbi:hypothetical protein C8Q78DRAFT_1071423 [Trametes maxima]|nr:hypothetical protein C8Q78DRAFT_1071423 [Trametes maxima]
MWQHYLCEFFDACSRLGCVGKPFSILFQRAHLGHDPAHSILLNEGFPTSHHSSQLNHIPPRSCSHCNPILLLPIQLSIFYLLHSWMYSGHIGLVWLGFSRPTRASPLLRIISDVCSISCATLPSLPRLAEVSSCFLLAPAAQELPNENHHVHCGLKAEGHQAGVDTVHHMNSVG